MTSTTTVEREARFLVHEPSIHRAVSRLTGLGPFRVIRRHHERQRNTYFDTEDMRLWRAKSVLKLRETCLPRGNRDRQAASAREVTFKKALAYRGGVASRLEITSRLRPAQREWMSRGGVAIEPMRRVRHLIGARGLRKLFTIETDRTTLILAYRRPASLKLRRGLSEAQRAKEGQRVELDVDRVAVRHRRRIIGRRLEIEVENLSATPAVFRTAIEALRHRYRHDLRLSGVSKFEFGRRVCYTTSSRHGTNACLH